jgi:hypothetical protein
MLGHVQQQRRSSTAKQYSISCFNMLSSTIGCVGQCLRTLCECTTTPILPDRDDYYDALWHLTGLSMTEFRERQTPLVSSLVYPKGSRKHRRCTVMHQQRTFIRITTQKLMRLRTRCRLGTARSAPPTHRVLYIVFLRCIPHV